MKMYIYGRTCSHSEAHTRDMDVKDDYKPGYHLTKIERGVVGQSSKILEEVRELMDAERQGCTVMALVELSDLIGAVEAYLRFHSPSVSVHDLMRMAAITRRAFENGYR